MRAGPNRLKLNRALRHSVCLMALRIFLRNIASGDIFRIAFCMASHIAGIRQIILNPVEEGELVLHQCAT